MLAIGIAWPSLSRSVGIFMVRVARAEHVRLKADSGGMNEGPNMAG